MWRFDDVTTEPTLTVDQVIDIWATALESGLYEQITDTLEGNKYDEITNTTKPAHCCLGVICEVLRGKAVWYEEFMIKHRHMAEALPKAIRDQVRMKTSTGAFEYDSLSEELRLEIETHACVIPTDNGFTYLANLNDYGVPFPVIAKVIRAKPKGLFHAD